MKFYTTFQAIDCRDGELKLFRGPNVEAIGIADANFVIESNNMFHLKLGGILIAEDGDNTEEKKLFN